jgi:hypothetical protein
MSSSAQQNRFESAIYQGFVRHRRFTPRRHEFKYPLFMLLLKLDELPELQTQLWQLGSRVLSWARFRRGDYLQPERVPLSVAVKQKIAELLPDVTHIEGDVFLLGQLRYLGLYFSPLNLYFLRQDGHFRYMLAEVSNTPWNERHYYLVDLDDIQPHDKAFHVSPFNPMQQRYHWKIVPPCAEKAKTMLHLESFVRETAGEKVFDATLVLKRKPLNQTELNRVLLKTPMQTASIVMGIYWQALKLLIKRVPLYAHPDKLTDNARKDLS